MDTAIKPSEQTDAISRAEAVRVEEIRKDLARNARPWYDTDIEFLLSLISLQSVPTGEQMRADYAKGVDDAQFIAVEALRGTNENYIPTNRALEIVDAAIKALKQGRDYKSAAPKGEANNAEG